MDRQKSVKSTFNIERKIFFRAEDFVVLWLVFLWEFDDKYDMIKFECKIRANRDGG